jgi:hypothetical protein
MSVEEKLDTLMTATAQIAANQAANQTAILNAVAAITPGGNSDAITAALAQIEAGVTQVNTTLGTEAAAAPAAGA